MFERRFFIPQSNEFDPRSSYGGFFGAVVGLFIFYGHRSRPLKTQILLCASPFLAALLVALEYSARVFDELGLPP